jgi:magnesium-transporting ATPase (P-type)
MLRIHAQVERDGEVREITADEVVPGDIVWLESGKRVPADIRLLTAHGLEVDESLLTGESLAVTKDAEWSGPEHTTLGDRAGAPESLLIRLVGAGARPLIAVPEQFRNISRVMIAYDGSMESAQAMKRFVQMRLWPNCHLKIMTFHPSEDQAGALLLAAQEYCRAHGFAASHQSNPGDPRILLLAAAKLWQADMIVMGSSARSGLMRRVLGDTLLAALRETRVPLFLAQ